MGAQFFVGLGFEFKALQLQSKHSKLEPHLQSILLWLNILEIESLELISGAELCLLSS
jgi:hypothetical protein